MLRCSDLARTRFAVVEGASKKTKRTKTFCFAEKGERKRIKCFSPSLWSSYSVQFPNSLRSSHPIAVCPLPPQSPKSLVFRWVDSTPTLTHRWPPVGQRLRGHRAAQLPAAARPRGSWWRGFCSRCPGEQRRRPPGAQSVTGGSKQQSCSPSGYYSLLPSTAARIPVSIAFSGELLPGCPVRHWSGAQESVGVCLGAGESVRDSCVCIYCKSEPGCLAQS